jgi:hypothetical protein
MVTFLSGKAYAEIAGFVLIRVQTIPIEPENWKRKMVGPPENDAGVCSNSLWSQLWHVAAMRETELRSKKSWMGS